MLLLKKYFGGKMTNLKELIVLFENAENELEEYRQLEDIIKEKGLSVKKSLSILDKFFNGEENKGNTLFESDFVYGRGMKDFERSKKMIFTLRDSMENKND